MPIEKYKTLIRQEFLSTKLPLDSIDLNNICLEKTPMRFINFTEALNSRKNIEIWSKKNYPETVVENTKILDDYLTLCEENNICPIIFLTPRTEGFMKYFSRKKLDEFYCIVNQALKKHSGARFFDGWKLSGFTDKDFYDNTHLNLQGAKKFSSCLNDFIEQLNQSK